MLNRYLKLITVAALSLLLSSVLQAATVKNVRMWLAPDKARLVFDLSGPVSHKIFSLSSPDRLVLDIKKSTIKANLSKLGLAKSPISRIRTAKKGSDLRVVFDLKEKVRPRSLNLKPNESYGHRLVVDLYREAKVSRKPVLSTPALNDKRDIVISIDAGHGGEDPGAIGPGGVREKKVVFAIAKRLKYLLDKEPGFRGRLTRTGDYYISLRGRTRLARKNNADMFVSIHADAFKKPSARGASVWVLSRRGASSEMGRWLVKRENSADLIGGVGSVSLDDKDKVLASVLLDLSMTASQADSRAIANNVHRNIARFAHMHKKHIEQAGFAVLKSPDIPSILVETGFISNPGEARKLKTASYQRKMADAVFRGIKAHFLKKPPGNSLIAWQHRGGRSAESSGIISSSAVAKHKVKRGENLSLIAKRYGMSVAKLKSLNGLKSNTIKVGQFLNVTTKVSSVRRYKVVRGDTLSMIASRNGVSLASLKSANNLRSNQIRIGQVLRIPTS